jgi:hypothetical protein
MQIFPCSIYSGLVRHSVHIKNMKLSSEEAAIPFWHLPFAAGVFLAGSDTQSMKPSEKHIRLSYNKRSNVVSEAVTHIAVRLIAQEQLYSCLAPGATIAIRRDKLTLVPNRHRSRFAHIHDRPFPHDYPELEYGTQSAFQHVIPYTQNM